MRTELSMMISRVLVDMIKTYIVLWLLMILSSDWADHVVGILCVLHWAERHLPPPSVPTFFFW